MERSADFLQRALPGVQEWQVVAPLGLLFAVASLVLAAWLKRRWRWRTGYTRKVFHFLVFGAAAAVHAHWGVHGVTAFGAAVSLVVLFAVARGEGDPGFEALARESDAPHRRWYVVVPWVATAAGGLLANLFFTESAVHGYLVVGLADAVAEPIGTRWGRHRYRVLLRGRVASTRSLEGSAAVLIASIVAVLVARSLGTETSLDGLVALRILLVALACTLLEAIAPHGWDNLVLQLAASGLAHALSL